VSPAAPTESDTVTFTVRIFNSGRGAAATSRARLKIGSASLGTVYDQASDVPAIEAGRNYTDTYRRKLPADSYRITITADSADTVDEADESNNEVSEVVRVNP
jgi:subtilase family serine protease